MPNYPNDVISCHNIESLLSQVGHFLNDGKDRFAAQCHQGSQVLTDKSLKKRRDVLAYLSRLLSTVGRKEKVLGASPDSISYDKKVKKLGQPWPLFTLLSSFKCNGQ